jgi:hypothetical protein
VDPIGLHVVRLFTGFLLVVWLLLTYAGNMESLIGPQGWLDTRAFGEAARLSNGAFSPGWSVVYLGGSNPAALTTIFWASVSILALFALGFLSRLTAILAWVVVASFAANPGFEYEGDALLLILSFYLLIGYVLLGQRTPGQSWLSRLLGPLRSWPISSVEQDEMGQPRRSVGANLALRLLQVHFAFVIVTSGLHKLQFGDWWAGVALWFPLHPPFKTTLAEALANKPHADTYIALLNIGTYAILAWQIGFPLFAWRRRWRPVLIGGAIIGWIGAAFVWGLPLIGPAMLIGCLSFVSPAEWRWVLGRLSRPSKADAGTVAKQQESASLVTAGQR